MHSAEAQPLVARATQDAGAAGYLVKGCRVSLIACDTTRGSGRDSRHRRLIAAPEAFWRSRQVSPRRAVTHPVHRTTSFHSRAFRRPAVHRPQHPLRRLRGCGLVDWSFAPHEAAVMDGVTEVRSRIAEIQTGFPRTTQPSAATDWASAAMTAGLTMGTTPSSVRTTSGTDAPPRVDAGGALSGASAAGSAIVANARQYLGVPYLWGGTDPSRGLDCSGFTQLVYKSQGIDLPRVSSQQATAGTAVGSLAEARPGDLLFFDYSPDRPGIDHVGIYVGDGQMIAAPQPGDVVKMQSAGQPTAIRRVLPAGAA